MCDSVKIPTPVPAIDPQFWSGRQVLLTGHTGFKGAWLALWLHSLGAHVHGLAPAPPTEPSLYGLARVGELLAGEHALDIRDAGAVRDALRRSAPEVVFHLAAQPMVRLSLREPLLTYEVNALGTANLLEAVRVAGERVRAVVVVTSDKCYDNPAAGQAGAGVRSVALTEGDPLGGRDPYSSSKACAELIAAAYRDSLLDDRPAAAPARIATARAGNVIGGGDFGEDRLVPDILRAHANGRPVLIRYPHSIRPWQHVLSPLSGYLTLAQALCGERTEDRHAQAAVGSDAARAWNFGPAQADARTVLEVVRELSEMLRGGLRWEIDVGVNPHEANRLELDSSAAGAQLGWRPSWTLEDALQRVARWHEAERANEDLRRVSLQQIAEFS